MHRPAAHSHPRVEAVNLAVVAKPVAKPVVVEVKPVARLVAKRVAVEAKPVARLVAKLVVVARPVARLVAKLVVVARQVAKPVVRGQAANLDLAAVHVAPGEDGVERTLAPATRTSPTSGTSISGLSTTAKVCLRRTV